MDVAQWAAGATYDPGAVVVSQGVIWRAVAGSTGVHPGSDPASWVPWSTNADVPAQSVSAGSVGLTVVPVPTDGDSWHIEHADPEGDEWTFPGGGVIRHTNPNVDTYITGYLTTVTGGFGDFSGFVLQYEFMIPSDGQDDAVFPGMAVSVGTNEDLGTGGGFGGGLDGVGAFGASPVSPVDFTGLAVWGGQSVGQGAVSLDLDTWHTVRVEATGPRVVVKVNGEAVAFVDTFQGSGGGWPLDEMFLQASGLVDFQNIGLWRVDLSAAT